jgi:AcrR family transcriptional regulator
MKKPIRRAYDSTARREGARSRQRAILESARHLFAKHGYAATSMPAIAKHAHVALDTIYASIGTKPKLLRLLIESALSGEDEAVEAERRDYVRAIRKEVDAVAKLRIYAKAIGTIQLRLAPILQVLTAAAPTDPDLAELWAEIATRRAANMLEFAKDLKATGRLRPDLSVEMTADIIWSMNAPEYYLLLVGQRGWSSEQFAAYLEDAWTRLLLT